MKIRYKFLQTLVLFLVLIIWCSCNRTAKTESENVITNSESVVESQLKKAEIILDTFCCETVEYLLSDYIYDSSGTFGYYHDDVDQIFPSGLDLDENNIYILDTYNSDIKRINLQTHELTISERVPDANHNMLFDLLVFQDYIVCSTMVENLYYSISNSK